jgi:hypothetical protein
VPLPATNCVDARDCLTNSQRDRDNDGVVDYSNHIDASGNGRADVVCTVLMFRECPVLCAHPNCAGGE